MGRFSTKIAIFNEGVLINEHSQGHRNQWDNPLDEVPAIGAKIEYASFSQDQIKNPGEVRLFKVVDIIYTTQEDFNNMFTGKVIEVHVIQIS